MHIINALNLACPIDGKTLSQTDKQLVCDNGHSYDIARQAYVNLLPVQHKRSKQPGDSKAMVVARKQFLDSGIYDPIATILNRTVLTQIETDKDICILDAGCGEGYYFNALLHYLQASDASNKVSLVGLDISKQAIAQAAKRSKQISWIVGSNRQPPVSNESIDIILCLFGFLSIKGFNDVLRPGGIVILIDPGFDHLKELRQIIYSEVKAPNRTDASPDNTAGFSLIHSESLRFNRKISDNAQIKHLFAMTPHFHRASQKGKAAALALQELDITFDVTFRVLQKTSV